ncbi:hypothetical protein ABH897_005183 [Paenibacillus sp. RC73]
MFWHCRDSLLNMIGLFYKPLFFLSNLVYLIHINGLLGLDILIKGKFNVDLENFELLH